MFFPFSPILIGTSPPRRGRGRRLWLSPPRRGRRLWRPDRERCIRPPSPDWPRPCPMPMVGAGAPSQVLGPYVGEVEDPCNNKGHPHELPRCLCRPLLPLDIFQVHSDTNPVPLSLINSPKYPATPMKNILQTFPLPMNWQMPPSPILPHRGWCRLWGVPSLESVTPPSSPHLRIRLLCWFRGWGSLLLDFTPWLIDT